eukprot:snap_masked-scaffold405_size181423-processed-gene-0.12 protein:Tk08176 transcript:snap_masked-scaffold405_size181423-processed-gene-0.12-mRNA-1 annotation:"paramyosin "
MAMSSRSAAAAGESSSAMASRKTTKTYTYQNDGSGNVSTEVHTHVDSSSDINQQAIRRMEERIRIITDDFESEQHLRKRIEREKQDLQIEIISLSERLTEAEGGAESQLDINRKREAEMAKLRKLLEEVHMHSEQSIHMVKTKHQQSMMELQEQINLIARSKEVVVKEKSMMSVEIQELLAQIEVLSREKSSIRKVVEKLEIQVHEYNVKMEDMNRTVMEVTSQKARLQQDNSDSNRKFNEMKMAIESAGMDKNKVASQLKELQVNLDNVSRQKMQAESKIQSVEQHFKSVTIELAEQRDMRIELERHVGKWKDECMDWKKKYEIEARLRIEDVDNLRKKYGVQIAELQDHLDAALRKIKELEQQKNRLQQEVQVIIKDLEISHTTIKEITMRFNSSEKRCEDLAAKLREMTNLYEKVEHENKARAQEIVRLSNDMDRCKMDNENLRRDNGKLNDDCRSYKAELEALKKRFHELDMENRKLAHDREELARAYKEADAGRHRAEARVHELENDLKNLRTDAERRLMAKDDELNATKKKMMTEIESLTIRLHEAESRLKNEVEKMKQKMVVTINELEMSLDASNKNNIQLQNTVKIQQTKIMELTSIYEEAHKRLSSTEERYNSVVQNIQIMEKEITVLRSELNVAVNDKRGSDSKIQELSVRITDITNINNQLTQVKMKLEKELTGVSGDYDDIARELKVADDRANKAGHDAQHYESLFRTEQTKVVQLDQARKALETEVRTMTIRMEEIETTALSSNRVTIKKMETRIEELEIMLEREKKMHLETVTSLHKKERSIKELLLQSDEDRKNIIILQESLEKLNEKIKMYKRQLDEQESISNSNIMRVKKFQRELESAENRAVEAESSLNAFRSRQRVYASADVRRENVSDEVEREVIVKKVIHNVNVSNVSDMASSGQSSGALTYSASSSGANASRDYRGGSAKRDYRAGSTMGEYKSSSSAMGEYRSSGAATSSSYSRAGSMARASSMARGTSMARAGSILRY